MKSKLSTLFSLLVIAGLLVACGGTATTAAPAQQKVVKIGLEGPFTGSASADGEQIKNATNMAFEAVNYKVGDYKIELVYVDDQADPAKATQAYEEAIVGQKIVAGLLGWNSSCAVAVMDVTAKYKVPHFFHMGATSDVNTKWSGDQAKYGYWVAKGWPAGPKTSVSYVQALEDAIKAGLFSPAEKKVAIYGEDTAWGRDIGNGLKDQFAAAGWAIASEDYFSLNPPQTDFQALVNRYKDANVPVIAGTSTSIESLSALIKQADENGLKALIIADGLGWVGNWYDMTGASSNYVIDQIPEFAGDAAAKFAADYEARFGMVASPSAAGLSYDWANYFIKILETTVQDYGDLTSENIYKVAQEKVWTGQLTYKGGIVMPEYKFDADSLPDPVMGKGFYTFPVRQYMDGKSFIIWPEEIANGKFQAKP